MSPRRLNMLRMLRLLAVHKTHIFKSLNTEDFKSLDDHHGIKFGWGHIHDFFYVHGRYLVLFSESIHVPSSKVAKQSSPRKKKKFVNGIPDLTSFQNSISKTYTGISMEFPLAERIIPLDLQRCTSSCLLCT